MPELEEEESSSLNEILAGVWRFLRKRAWWILLPGCGLTLVGLAVILRLPNRYKSEATLMVVRQQVPERYVTPNSTTDSNAVLQSIRQEILSRTRLLVIIKQFNLYAGDKAAAAPETLVDRILQDIEIEPILNPNRKDLDFDALKISFVAGDPVLAQSVDSNLASLFINESLRTREEQAIGTTTFLHQQVEAKAKLLQEQEQRLSTFKLQHIGELPEQQGNNLGILTGLNQQLNNTSAALSRAQEHRVFLETLLNSYKRAPQVTQPVSSAPDAPVAVTNRGVTPLETAQTEVSRLQTERAAMLKKGWTSQHPDMKKLNRELATAEDLVIRLKAVAPPSPKEEIAPSTPSKASAPVVTANPAEDPAAAQYRSQLESNRVEIENLTKEEARLKSEIAGYQARLNQTPVREQEQASILRETEAIRQDYANLQKKEQESALATNLEKQQGGQQFRLVDAPNLPLVPSSPNRLKLSGIVTGVGFGLGIILALFMHSRDTSFLSERELANHLSPPFVIGIPLLRTPLEQQRIRARNMFQWLAGSAMVLMVLGAEFYVYYKHGLTGPH